MHVLWWISVGLIAGWATGKIMRVSGYGAFMDIFLGIIGAVVGGWIMRAFGTRRHDLHHSGYARRCGACHMVLGVAAGATARNGCRFPECTSIWCKPGR